MRCTPFRVGPALLVLTCATAALLPALAGDDASWDQWRGPQRDGRVEGPAWPGDLDGLEQRWRVELGKGYPGPIVGDGRVFVVETVDKKTVGVRALALDSGEELWKATWDGTGSVPFFARSNGDWVRSTTAYDGKTLYVGDMAEVMVALDGATGEECWRVDLPARFDTAVPDFGFASSPLLDGDALYVQAANSLVKLNKKSGETIWRSLEATGKMTASGAFSSPVIAEIRDERQLVVLTRHALNGIDPADGSVLWTQPVPNFRGMNILTPVVADDAIFTSPYRERSYLYRVGRQDDIFAIAEAWTHKATGYMSSPVVIDDHAYLHLGNGRVTCIDLASGETRWTSEPFGKYWSMVWQGDKILALDEQGELHLLRATPERFEPLGSAEVSETESWGHLAVAGNAVLVRELKAIAVYDWRERPAGKTR